MEHDIVVFGASAGGIEALRTILPQLPRDLPAALFIVVHTEPTDRPSLLDKLLNRVSALPVSAPQDGEVIQRGQIYVAPPNYHLSLQGDRIRLSKGPLQNGLRPAIDVLFRSAALAFGPRVIGVVLSGMLRDGSDGLLAIKSQGGIAIVQNPEEAAYPDMPMNALRKVPTDHVVALARIPELLVELTKSPVVTRARAPDPLLRFEAEADVGKLVELESFAKATSFICPHCGGGMWKLNANGSPRYRCEVGHSYSIEAFGEQQKRDLEHALWAAIRSLDNRANLCRELEAAWRARGSEDIAEDYAEEARSAAKHGISLRELLGVRTK
jgi:two-component system, chemotaxis family, protein-glutamate methylesterase/glutaminase